MHTSSSIINPNPNNFPQQPEQQLKCPRCDSLNTKFCYYNNYNLSQPRHFCKNCRRYWTKGGTLRNIPIGGGTRKISKRHPNPNKTATIPVPQQLQLIGEAQKDVVGGGYSMGPFGNLLMEGLSMSKADGNDPIGDDFRSNFLKLNDNHGNNNGAAGDDGWPHLSIFTSVSGANLSANHSLAEETRV